MSQVVLFSSRFSDPGIGKVNPYVHTRRGLLPAIYRLATHLRNKGFTVSTIATWWCDFDIFKEIIRLHIDPNETRLVGISTTLFTETPSSVKPEEQEFLNFDIYRKIEFIKTHAPGVKIVVGGSSTEFITVDYKRRKPYELVDMFCSGQGETVIEQILNNIYTGSRIISSNIAPTIYSDLIYPFNEFNSCYTEYLPQDYINETDCLGIEMSRGCIFSCSYCTHPMLGKKPNEFIKDKKTLREEFIRNYETLGTKYYYFTDNLLNENLEKMEDLAEATANLPFKLQYGAYIRLDLIHKFPEMANLMRDSGLIGGSAGIETINLESGKSVRKGLGLERTNEALEICFNSWKDNVALEGLFMIGLPHDTIDTVYELEEWLNTPLVKKSMTNFFAQPLYHCSDEMASQNDKLQYTFDETKPIRDTAWTNRNGLTFDQAKKDSAYITSKFLKKYRMSDITVNTLNMPQLLAYAEKHHMYDDVRNAFLHRIPSEIIKDRASWDKLTLDFYTQRSNEYMKNLLNK